MLGVWLVISPWVLDFSGDGDGWNAIAAGAAVTLLAFAGLATDRLRAFDSLILAVGAWLIVSALWLTEVTAATWNAAVVGAVLILLAVFALGSLSDEQRLEEELQRRRDSRRTGAQAWPRA